MNKNNRLRRTLRLLVLAGMPLVGGCYHGRINGSEVTAVGPFVFGDFETVTPAVPRNHRCGRACAQRGCPYRPYLVPARAPAPRAEPTTVVTTVEFTDSDGAVRTVHESKSDG